MYNQFLNRLKLPLFLLIFFSQTVSAQTSETEEIMVDAFTNPEKNNTDFNGIFQIVEQNPTFQGGRDNLLKFISKTMRYPKRAKKTGIQGNVFVEFIVEKDGSLTNAVVKKSIGGGCDEEAIRIVSKMPKFSPGMQSGNKVRVRYTLPIKFSF